MSKAKRRILKANKSKPRCGLCGQASKPLTKTECCDNWICDDWDNYQMFSYAHNSCSRNHDRYTMCSTHFREDHSGDWQDCQKCRDYCEPEMYIYYGTNEYNFVKLKDLPEYEPTRCTSCNDIIVLAEGGYSQSSEGYFCLECSNKKFEGLMDL